MATFWVGTSGYTHKEWRGSFYPSGLPEEGLLRYYGEHLSTVELNYTFYKSPNVRTLQGWAKEVPERFAFTLKAPRRITHDLKLRDAADPVIDFCETASALKARLGVLLFQLPQFLKRDVARLEDFLHQMPPDFRVAFELRHNSWYTDEVFDLLRKFDVALCVVDAADREVPWEATARFGYFRLRQPDYSDEDLERCARRIEALAGNWEEAYLYFKHEAEGRGPFLAARLRSILEGASAPAAAGF